jgi:hypothetical protein
VVPIGEPGDVKRIVPAAGVEEPAAGVVGAPGEEAGAEVEVAVVSLAKSCNTFIGRGWHDRQSFVAAPLVLRKSRLEVGQPCRELLLRTQPGSQHSKRSPAKASVTRPAWREMTCTGLLE